MGAHLQGFPKKLRFLCPEPPASPKHTARVVQLNQCPTPGSHSLPPTAPPLLPYSCPASPGSECDSLT